MSTSRSRSKSVPHPVLPGSPASGLTYAIDRDAVMPDLQTLVGNAIQTIEATQPAPDAILGGFVRLTSLCRSVSFHEGKLLESALIRFGGSEPRSRRAVAGPAVAADEGRGRGGRQQSGREACAA